MQKFISKNNRECPICNGTDKQLLFIQKFANGFLHNIVICKKCGFSFVDNTYIQQYYNRYYKKMSKYELERDHGAHSLYVKVIKDYSSKNDSILDIGASTGHLLYLLKKHGYKKLMGIDPSPACKIIAKNKFNVQVETSNIFSFKPKRKFKFIVLAMVLEHLEKIREAISHAGNLLEENGYMFISIPDASGFNKSVDEPFGEFSVEHINFFSTNNLFELMKEYKCCYIKSDGKIIYSIWEKTKSLEEVLNEYINMSEIKLKDISEIISKLPDRILVWGAGSLTQRLLATTNLNYKVLKFIDKNKNLIGKELQGKEIISPSKIRNYKEAIFISSFKFKNEIIQEVKRRKLRNKLFLLTK